MEGGTLLMRLYPISLNKEIPIFFNQTMFQDLKLYLIANILTRLPVKNIILFTSVHTHFNNYLRTSTFVARQIRRAVEYGENYLLVLPSSSNSCSLISEKTYKEEIIEMPFCFNSGFVSSCNGLICVGDARDFHLWNPSVYMYIQIKSSCYDDLLNDPLKSYSVIGFGYLGVRKEEDFKVVRVFFGSDVLKLNPKLNPRVEVYSLRSNSWRKLDCDVPRLLDQKACVFADGFIYWLELKNDDDPVVWIVSFDLKKNVFEEFKLPRYLRRNRAEKVSLMKFKGLVSVCCSYAAGDCQKKYSAWVLRRDEIDSSVSWTEQFRTVTKVVGSPMMFTSCGKLVLQTLNSLTLFDPEKKKFMLIGSDGPYTGGHNSFVETIALFGEKSNDVKYVFETKRRFVYGGWFMSV